MHLDPYFLFADSNNCNYLRFIGNYEIRSDFHLSNVCKICNGAEQNIFMNGDEPTDPIDCVCTDMRWDSENQDKCLECKGTGMISEDVCGDTVSPPKECEYCNNTGVRK